MAAGPAAARTPRPRPDAADCGHGRREFREAAAGPLGDDELRLLDAYWRAANYLSVGQIYLLDNPLLREPLRPEHVKPRLLGHFGTTPGLNLVYAHLNRAIRARDLDAIYVTGPGPRRARRSSRTRTSRARTASSTRTIGAGRGRAAQALPPVLVPRRHPEPRRAGDAGLDPRGRRARLRARRTRSAPPSTTPTSLVACVVGDGEAETGPLAASWHSNKFLNPRTRRRRAADPAPERLQDREPDRARADPRGRARSRSSRATAGEPLLVTGGFDGEDPSAVHQRFAAALDEALDEIAAIQRDARARSRDGAPALADARPADAEGLDGPEGGRRQAGRGHLALAPGAARRACATNPEHLRAARGVAAELPAGGALRRATGASCRSSPRSRPQGERRMSANPHANGGELLRDLVLPDFRDYAVEVPQPGHRRRARRRASSARSCATSIARNPDNVPPLRARRDGVEPARRRLRGDRRGPGSAEIAADRRGPRARRPRDGDALRAPLPGLARGLPAHRAGTASSTATRRSSTSSTRCSTSTRSG